VHFSRPQGIRTRHNTLRLTLRLPLLNPFVRKLPLWLPQPLSSLAESTGLGDERALTAVIYGGVYSLTVSLLRHTGLSFSEFLFHLFLRERFDLVRSEPQVGPIGRDTHRSRRKKITGAHTLTLPGKFLKTGHEYTTALPLRGVLGHLPHIGSELSPLSSFQALDHSCLSYRFSPVDSPGPHTMAPVLHVPYIVCMVFSVYIFLLPKPFEGGFWRGTNKCKQLRSRLVALPTISATCRDGDRQ